MTIGDHRGVQQTRQGDPRGLRGINGQDGVRLLQAVKQGFEQFAHGIKAVVIEQCSQALPQQAFAAHLRPHGSEQGTAQLLGLVHQKRQQHHHRKHHRQIVHAMSVIVFEVVALIFQRIERFIFNLPAGSSASREEKDAAPADPQVRHPTKVLD